MLSQSLREAVSAAVKKHSKQFAALSDYLAEHPELPDEEFESSRMIADILREKNYSVEYPFCGYATAFCAEMRNGNGASVAILTEYDALPDIGHACGHNLHGAMSAMAGVVLMELNEHFKGKILVIGTPAEEMDGAKIGMADKGVFDGFDIAMMFHSSPAGLNQMALNLLALKCYDFTFSGATAHAAVSPWLGKNALSAARKFLDLVDARRQCFKPDMRASGIFLEGGKYTNIIPDKAQVRIEMRGATSQNVEDVFEGIVRCAKGAALALDCEVEWKPHLSDFADMLRNYPAEERMQQIMESLGLKVSPVSPPGGSSDIGNVSYKCPAIHPMIAITSEECSLHTIEFARATTKPEAHEALEKGAEALVLMALDVMQDETLRSNMTRAFIERKN